MQLIEPITIYVKALRQVTHNFNLSMEKLTTTS